MLDGENEQPAAAHFKAEARRAFASLCERHGLREAGSSRDDHANDFELIFTGARVLVRVKGINFGDNAAVYFETPGSDPDRYSIWQIMRERPPESPPTGTQIEQLYWFARYLEVHAEDALSGNPGLFEAIDRRQATLQLEKDAAQQAQDQQKRDEGYVERTTPFGTRIWCKPSINLTDPAVVRSNFPASRELRGRDLLQESAVPLGQPIVVVRWIKEIGADVEQGEKLVEVELEKANVELPAPLSGKILWLAPEGEALELSTVVALMLPARSAQETHPMRR